MKMNEAAREALLGGVERVYNAFLALEFAEDKIIHSNGQTLSLFEIAKEMIEKNELSRSVQIGNQTLTLGLQAENGQYKVDFEPKLPMEIQDIESLKKPGKEGERLALMASQDIYLDAESKHPTIQIHNHDRTSHIEVGGNKVSLYSTHLLTLFRIREKLAKGGDISNMLVALATGSGKTYVQALWLASLHSAGKRGFFGVPGHLVEQFRGDLKSLLPDEFVEQQVGFLGDATDQNRFLGQDKPIVLDNSFKVLDEHLEQLIACDPNEVMMTFDEQHLLMRVERRHQRLLGLAKKFLSTFLTATPDEETFHLCGDAPVASMSNKEKEKAGHGQIPDVLTLKAKSATDMNRQTKGLLNRLARRIAIAISDAVQEQPSSAAVQVMDELPYMTQPFRIGDQTEIQYPVRNKLLFLVDDPDSLINLCYQMYQTEPNAHKAEGTNNKKSDEREIYAKGNLCSRGPVDEVLHVGNVDIDLNFEATQRRKIQLTAAQENQQIQLPDLSVRDHMKANIFHNMVDYLLGEALGMDQIQLNAFRKENQTAFYQQLVKKLEDNNINLDATYFIAQLVPKIGADGAKALGPLLGELWETMRKKNEWVGARRIVPLVSYQNHPANDELMQELLKEKSLKDQFDNYAEEHLVLCVMDDMRSSDLKIRSGRPFWGLNKTSYKLYDEGGGLSENAKTRPHGTLEALNPDALETKFEPKYDAHLSQAQADQYFKLGFVGAYMSNCRTEGFSDVNLQVVIHVCQEQGQRLNGPDKLLQGLGRNRGLDKTKKPLFIQALGRNQAASFDMRHLDKLNYYKDYFRSSNRFKKPYLEFLGDRLAHEIILSFHESMGELGRFDEKAYHDRVMYLIREDLREINGLNNHQLKLSRRQLAVVLDRANKRLDEHTARLNTPNRMSTFVSWLGSVMNALYSIQFYFKQRPARSKLRNFLKSSENQYDLLYSKILKVTNYKRLVKVGFISGAIKAKLDKQTRITKAILHHEPLSYLKQAQVVEFNQLKDSTLIPLLLKYVIVDRQPAVRQALETHPDLLGFIYKNRDVLKKLEEKGRTDREVQQDLRDLFRQLDGLADLEKKDFVNATAKARILEQKNEQGIAAFLDDETCAAVAAGVDEQFIQCIKPKMKFLLLPDDYEKVEAGLTAERSRAFIQAVLVGHREYLLTNGKSGLDVNDDRAVLKELSRKISQDQGEGRDDYLRHPEEQLALYQRGMEELKKQIELNPMTAMRDEQFTHLSEIFERNILPAMINLCPYEHRSFLQQRVTRDQVNAMLRAMDMDIFKQDNQLSQKDLANLVLSRLVNQNIQYAQEPGTVEAAVKASFLEIFKTKKETSAANILQGGVAIFKSWRKLGQGTATMVKEVQENYLASVFEGDEFWRTFSTLISPTAFGQLQAALTWKPGLAKSIAKAFLEARDKGEEPENPEDLVKMIAAQTLIQLDYVGELAEKGESQLSRLNDLMDENPSRLVKQEIVHQVANQTRANFYPALAKYIKDERRRDDFLTLCNALGDEQLFDFLANQADTLADLHEEDLAAVSHLIAELEVLDNRPYRSIAVKDLQVARFAAEDLAQALSDRAELEVIKAYLQADSFKEIIRFAYNDADQALILAALSDKEKIQSMAEALFANNEMETDEVFAHADVEVFRLDRRKDELTQFLDRLEENKNEVLDQDKMNILIQKQILTELTSPLVMQAIGELLQPFEEIELGLLLNSLNITSPDAKMLKDFYQALKTQDMRRLSELCIGDNPDYDHLPLQDLMDAVKSIHEELVKCHCHFNQHGQKGELVHDSLAKTAQGYVSSERVKPNLFNKLSSELQNIMVKPNDESTQKEVMIRRVRYLRGLQNAFPLANQVHQRANQEEIDKIRHIQKNVLVPVRERAGKWAIQVAARDLISGTQSTAKSVAKGIYNTNVTVHNAIMPRAIHLNKTTDEKEADQAKKDATSFAIAMNKLRPLDQKVAQDLNAPMEVVDNLLAENPYHRARQKELDRSHKKDQKLFKKQHLSGGEKGGSGEDINTSASKDKPIRPA